MIKADLRQRIIDMASSTSSSIEYDTTASTGEVDLHMGIVHSKEWKRLLNANPYIRVARRTPTVDSSARILVTDLSATGENFYRVLMVAINNTPYKEIISKEGLLAGIQVTTGSAMPGSNIWFRQGDYIYVPDAANAVTTGVWVNHIPTRADLLATDASAVVFPADYEDVLVYEAAATLMDKGGTHSNEGEFLRNRAETLRRDMLQDVARFSIAPQVFAFSDTASEWGG